MEKPNALLAVRWNFLFHQLTNVAQVQKESLIMSSFIWWWLYKSVIAIFDTIIIIMINDYEYYSIVSVHLSHRVQQDKNKDCGDNVRSSADLCLGFAVCHKPESPLMHSGFYVVVS